MPNTSRVVGLLLIFGVIIVATPTESQTPIAPPPAWSPFLDCGARIYAIDGLICEDADLLNGARQVEATYRQAAVSPDLRDALQTDQLEWSKRRNLCAFDRKARRCVKRLQTSRTAALRKAVLKWSGAR